MLHFLRFFRKCKNDFKSMSKRVFIKIPVNQQTVENPLKNEKIK